MLQRRPKDREKLDHSRLPKRLFDQVDGDAPPGQDSANDPEVAGYFHPSANAGAVGEEAAGDGRADSEGREDAAEDEVTGGGCDCLFEGGASVSYWRRGCGRRWGNLLLTR